MKCLKSSNIFSAISAQTTITQSIFFKIYEDKYGGIMYHANINWWKLNYQRTIIGYLYKQFFFLYSELILPL